MAPPLVTHQTAYAELPQTHGAVVLPEAEPPAAEVQETPTSGTVKEMDSHG